MTAGVGQHPGRGSGRGGSTRGCHVGGVFDDRPRSARCRAWRRRAGRAWFRGPRRARAGLAGSLIASLLGCAAGDSSAPGFDAPRLALEAELRIGSVDDPELAFTWFRGLVVGPDGRIYTAHPQENAIRVHDGEGRPVGRIGRAGEGPGEFRSLGPIGILGDTLLWALDYGTYRFSFFDLDGTLVRSLNVPTRMGATLEERPPRASGLFSDGSIMASPPAWDNLVADGTISQDSILRMDSTGAVLELVTTIPLHNTTLAVTDPRDPRGFGAYFPQPYSDTELVKISPFDSSIVRVDRRAAEDARVGAFRVTRLHFRGDTIFSREYRYSPIPLDPARPDSIVREYAERVGRVPSPPAPTVAEAERILRERIYTPRFLPPVTGLVVGRDGTIWLRREERGESDVDWLILAADGEPLGLAATPAGFNGMAADRSAIWGMELDSLDVPYIVKYRIAAQRD